MRAYEVSPARLRRSRGSTMKRTRMLSAAGGGGPVAGTGRARLVAAHAHLGGQQVLEAVLAQPVVQRRPVDAESASGAGDVAARPLDREDDLLLLALEEPLGQRPLVSADRDRSRDRLRRRRR